MNSNFLKITATMLRPNEILLRDLYIFLEKNNRMLKVRECGFYFDENSLQKYIAKNANFYVFEQNPNIKPDEVVLYERPLSPEAQIAPQPPIAPTNEIEMEKKFNKDIVLEDEEKLFSSEKATSEVTVLPPDFDQSEEEKRIASQNANKEIEQRFDGSRSELEQRLVKGHKPEDDESIQRFGADMEKKADDSVFIFSASDSEDTPIYSSKKLQSMLETSKEMLIRDQRSNQSTSKKKTSDSFENIFVKKDINEEVASIVYSSVLAEKGKEIAELLLGEHDSEKKDLLKKDLEEKILQLKKIKARENASLSEEEKNTADERIKTFNMIADRVDLSNEERLIKLSEIAEAMDESMRLAMDKIDKAKEQIQFDSVFKRKTAVNSTLANFIAFLAISIGYSNEDFLVDLALSGLIKKNKANLKISALPDLVKFLVNGDGEGSLQLSLQDDATQIL